MQDELSCNYQNSKRTVLYSVSEFIKDLVVLERMCIYN